MTEKFDDETLVAYLDGELDTAQTQELEAVLPSSQELRQRLLKLRQTWDLLEDIPMPPANNKFTASTMEMIALTEDTETPSWLSWISRNSANLMLLLLPLFFLGGYLFATSAQGRADRGLLSDLPLLVDWRSLNNIDSAEWLQVLMDEPDLVAAMDDVEMNLIGGDEIPNAIEQRRQWVEQLSDSDRLRLKDALDEFRQRTPEMQSQMREIASSLIASPADSKSLAQAVRAYSFLLQDLSLTQRASLKDMPITQRKEELRRLINWQMVVNYRHKMPEGDVEAIRAWSERVISNYKYQISYPWEAPRSVYHELTVNWQFSEIGEPELLELEGQLSAAANSILSRFDDSKSRFEVLIFWLAKVAFPQESSTEKLDADKLRKIYSELKGNDLERLELLPPNEVQDALRVYSTKNRSSEPSRPQE